MSIVFPLSLPVSPNFAEIEIQQNSTVAVTADPYSGTQEVQVYDGQWWDAKINLPTLNNEQSRVWDSFFGKLNGREGTFLLGDPARRVPFGTASITPGVPIVDGAHAARTNVLAFTGAPASKTGWLLSGSHIQVGGGSTARLFKVLDDVDTDGLGTGSILIWPRLREALTGGEAITLSDPKGVFRLSVNQSSMARRPGVFSEASVITAREAF